MSAQKTATLAEHIQELRRRLIWGVAFIVIGAGIGYLIHDQLIALMQKPLHETLYYTTPTGAFSFIIKVCTVFGFLVALPVIIYQSFAFLGPLIKKKTKLTFASFVSCSFILAVLGILFAYFISLPASLHFLVNFTGGNDVEALITANEYFNFVLTYIAGFAVLFQLPLIILFINRIKPLKPTGLFKGMRLVILGSFIAAAIITPTPDPLNQFLMAAPIIALYVISIVLVIIINSLKRKPKTAALLQKSIFSSQPVAERPVTRPAANVPSRPLRPQYSTQMHQARSPRLITDFAVPAQVHRMQVGVERQQIRANANIRTSNQTRPRGVISDFYNPGAHRTMQA